MLAPSPLSALHRWAARRPDANTIPDHLFLPAERQARAESFRVSGVSEALLMGELKAEFERESEGYARRREIEHAIADYLARHGVHYDLQEKLRSCRMTGNVGWREGADGGLDRVIAWDHKCSLVRLCPDEAREEQQRLAEKYVPAIEQWARAQKGRQVQYCVLTWPNIAPGELAEKKREMLRQVSAWLKRKPCRAIKGALAVQEDPLSADGSWNLHVNLVLLVQGAFNWSDARASWYKFTRQLFPDSRSDYQCHFRDVTRGNLVKTVLELVKYSAKHVSAKNTQKGQQLIGASGTDARPGSPSGLEAGPMSQPVSAGNPAGAPGLTEWPIERFEEWWAAGLGFRRSRSYGVLYRVKATDEAPGLENVQWVGRIRFDADAGRYAVKVSGSINLIPGDNSGSAHRETDNSARAGPPGPRSRPPGAVLHS